MGQPLDEEPNELIHQRQSDLAEIAEEPRWKRICKVAIEIVCFVAAVLVLGDYCGRMGLWDLFLRIVAH